MDRAEMELRTKRFGLRVLALAARLTRTDEARMIRRQVVRCGTSVGANYRAAGRARTRKEFFYKLGLAEEECDETCYWLELIIEGELMPEARVRPLLREANELVSILVASQKKRSL